MRLGLYYLDFNKVIGEDFSEYEFNEQGIPLVRFHRSLEYRHNPVTVCQYALTLYNKFIKTGDIQSKNKFFSQANWLLQNYESGPNNSAVWYYRLNAPFYKLRSPWISGMAQGEALSVLLRAFQLTSEDKYYQLAQKVSNIFSVTVEDGGVIGAFPDGLLLIEEYPSRPGSCVLNGFMLALLGIYDFWLANQEQKWNDFFGACINSLNNNLNLYDTTYWSLYDLWKPYRLTARFYHRLHFILLHELYKITNEHLFFDTSERWKSYLKSPICNIKWAVEKIKERMEL